MELHLEGRVAVVAAASAGLGKAVATQFAAEGASVAICGRGAETIEAAAEDIRRETDSQVLAVRADVTDPDELSGFIETTIAKLGRVDTLVCNAGGPPPGKFDDVDDAEWDLAVQLTLMSAVRLIRFSLPEMKKSGEGRIVCMSSSSIKQPIPGLILSNTLRLGLHGMVKTLSDEVAKHRILVNTVAPGRFDTGRVRSLDAVRAEKAGISEEEQRTRTEQEIAVGRYGATEEFARYVVFLGSPANTYVTGQALLVDGGLTRSL